MDNEISRRKMLGMTAGAAATALTTSQWVYTASDSGVIVKAATKDSASDWKPTVLTKNEVEQVAAVCEAIIPRTDTAGARDARVQEYIDVALSIEGRARQRSFTEGLKWTDRHCKKVTGNTLQKASDEEVSAALAPLSDEHESHPANLKQGASFFKDIKRRTIFGYYTSVEGRVEELGKPAEVRMDEIFRGCTHGEATH